MERVISWIGEAVLLDRRQAELIAQNRLGGRGAWEGGRDGDRRVGLGRPGVLSSVDWEDWVGCAY